MATTSYGHIPTIRVLRIQPSSNDDESIGLTLRYREDGEKYVCLSYCWGDETPNKSILINGSTYLIRPRLFEFLSTARRYDFDVLLWIDAICIQQDDEEEKQTLIPRMGQIYANAEFVVVWLGLTDLDLDFLSLVQNSVVSAMVEPTSEVAVTAASSEERVYRNHEPAWLKPFNRGLLNSVTAIYKELPLLNTFDYTTLHKVQNNPYWHRAWIVQEVAMSRSAWLLGPHTHVSVNLKLLARVMAWFASISDPYPSADIWEQNEIYERLAMLMSTPLQDHKAYLPRFGDAMRITYAQNSRYRRDRIYSILSISSIDNGFPISYSVSDLNVLFQTIIFVFCQVHENERERNHSVSADNDLLAKVMDIWDFKHAVLHTWKCLESPELRPPRENEALPDVETLLSTELTSLEEGAYWLRKWAAVSQAQQVRKQIDHDSFELALCFHWCDRKLLLHFPRFKTRDLTDTASWDLDTDIMQLWSLDGSGGSLLAKHEFVAPPQEEGAFGPPTRDGFMLP